MKILHFEPEDKCNSALDKWMWEDLISQKSENLIWIYYIPHFAQLVPGWYIYLRTFWRTEPPLIKLKVKNQNEKQGRFRSGCVHTIVLRFTSRESETGWINYNCVKKYFNFAWAIECKLLVWTNKFFYQVHSCKQLNIW